MKKLTILFISMLLMGTTAEAQFLKKLQKKIGQKVENKVIDNVSDKAAAETEASLNQMWDMDLSSLSTGGLGGERVDPALIPESYHFDWEYGLTMTSEHGEMELLYLLKKDEPYFGMKVPNATGMLMVMDGEQEMMVMFMDSNGSKMLTATKLDTGDIENSETENPYEDTEVREIASKEIMGYHCKGYQTETPEHIFTFYVTDEAGVGFSDIFKANEKNAPKGFDADWLMDGSGLMMEMDMVDKKDASKNVSMRCTSLEQKEFSISKAGYQTF